MFVGIIGNNRKALCARKTSCCINSLVLWSWQKCLKTQQTRGKGKSLSMIKSSVEASCWPEESQKVWAFLHERPFFNWKSATFQLLQWKIKSLGNPLSMRQNPMTGPSKSTCKPTIPDWPTHEWIQTTRNPLTSGCPRPPVPCLWASWVSPELVTKG